MSTAKATRELRTYSVLLVEAKTYRLEVEAETPEQAEDFAKIQHICGPWQAKEAELVDRIVEVCGVTEK